MKDTQLFAGEALLGVEAHRWWCESKINRSTGSLQKQAGLGDRIVLRHSKLCIQVETTDTKSSENNIISM
jgi:hypothetical protein